MEHWTEIFAALYEEGPYTGLDFEEDRAKQSLNLMRNKLPLTTPANLPRKLTGAVKEGNAEDSNGETFFEPKGANLEIPENADQECFLPATLFRTSQSNSQ